MGDTGDPDPPPGHHKWCPSGLQDWSPVPEGNSPEERRNVAGALTRRGLEARRILAQAGRARSYSESGSRGRAGTVGSIASIGIALETEAEAADEQKQKYANH